MEVLHARCAGLDVHKRSVVACVLLTQAEGSVRREVRTLGTMTADLLALPRLVGSVWGRAGGDGKHRSLHSGRSSICWRTAMRSSWSIPNI
jgi:hypothetical protein